MGIPGDFPQVAVGVGEASGIAAPEGVFGGFGNFGPGVAGLSQNRIDFFLRARVEGQNDAGRFAFRSGFHGKPGVGGQRIAAIERKDRPARLKESDLRRAVGGGPAQALVKRRRATDICDAQGDQAYSLFDLVIRLIRCSILLSALGIAARGAGVAAFLAHEA